MFPKLHLHKLPTYNQTIEHEMTKDWLAWKASTRNKQTYLISIIGRLPLIATKILRSTMLPFVVVVERRIRATTSTALKPWAFVEGRRLVLGWKIPRPRRETRIIRSVETAIRSIESTIIRSIKVRWWSSALHVDVILSTLNLELSYVSKLKASLLLTRIILENHIRESP